MVPTATVTLIAGVCVVLYRTIYTLKFMPSVWMHSMVGDLRGLDGAILGTLPVTPRLILCSLHPFRDSSGVLSPLGRVR